MKSFTSESSLCITYVVACNNCPWHTWFRPQLDPEELTREHAFEAAQEHKAATSTSRKKSHSVTIYRSVEEIRL